MGLGMIAMKVCLYFLAIFNGALAGMGIGIFGRGIIYYILAKGASSDYWLRVSRIDVFYQEVSWLFIAPGIIMVVVGFFGFRCALCKTEAPVCYTVLLLAHIGAKIYAHSASKDGLFSIYSYLKILFSSLDVESLRMSDFTSNHADGPEYGIEVALLVVTFYTVYYLHRIKKEEKELIAARDRLVRLHAAQAPPRYQPNNLHYQQTVYSYASLSA